MGLLMIVLTVPRPAAAQGPPAAPVRVAAAEARTIVARQRTTGELRAVTQVQVASEEAGRVTRIAVEPGDRVARGDILAQLDGARLEIERIRLAAEIAVAEAVIVVRRAEAARVEADLERLERLGDRDAVNPREIADKALEAAIARARVVEAERLNDVARQSMALLERRCADMTIVAPGSGVIIRRMAEVGGWIAAGAAVVELMSDDAWDVVLDVPQQVLADLPGGASPSDGAIGVTIEIASTGQSFIDLPARRIPHVDPVARTFRLYVRIDDPAHRLAQGMSAVGWIPLGRRQESMVIPADALMESATGFFVFAIRTIGDGPPVAAPIPVRLLFPVAEGIVVESPELRAGDQVVVEGNERLFPMSPVRLVSPPVTTES